MAKTKLMQKISKDMLIGEVVANYPEVIDAIMEEGVHCVGCGAANWETIEQGLMGHGKSDEEINQVVEKLNKIVNESSASSSAKSDKKPIGSLKVNSLKDAKVIVTQSAANKLNDIIKKEKKEGYGLRIAVRSGGCSGKTYELTLENKKQEDDSVITVHGAKFYFDQVSLSELNGSTVDYVDTLQGAGFKISNPNAKSTCGCGESYN